MNVRPARRLYRAARVVLPLALLCTLLLFSGCAPAEEKQPQYYFTAQVEAITDTTMRVKVYDPGRSELKEGTTLTLSTETYSESSLEDISAGNLVRVVMADPIDGDAAEPVVPFSIEREYTQPR